MTDGSKVALALGGAALGAIAVAIGVAVASPKTATAPTPSPTPTPAPTPAPGPAPSPSPGVLPPPGAVTWSPAPATIAPGTRMRISIAPADLAVVAQSIGTTPDLNGFKDLLSNPIVQSAIQAATITVWGPDPTTGAMNPGPLPSDWPSDDPSPSTEYHADFIYGGPGPLVLSAFPVPVRAWVAH